MSFFKEQLVSYLMPEKCYERIFLRYSVDGACLKFVLNRIAGFLIILDTFFAQLPQLMRILWRGRVDGLSLSSSLLQLYAVSCPVVYAMANNFPFFAWAERFITLAQAASIVFLILHYRGETLKGLLLLSAYSGLMVLLGSYTAKAVSSVMQASSVAALAASKGFQAGTNYSNGHTGQLSYLTVFISSGGALGAVYVSLQDLGSSLDTVSRVLSACLSLVLLVQVHINSSDSSKKKTE